VSSWRSPRLRQISLDEFYEELDDRGICHGEPCPTVLGAREDPELLCPACRRALVRADADPDDGDAA
jgi:hypothetical protein